MSQAGTVKLFHKDRGFGFITAEDGQEFFCHIAGLADNKYPQSGDAVAFDLEESKVKPGQMQATNVTGGTGASTRGDAEPTGQVQGTCKSFNELKGFGFIVGEDENDIFFFCNDCADGRYPRQGDTLIFDCEESAKEPGKLVGKNVTGGTGGFSNKGKDGKGKDGKGKGKGKDDLMGMVAGMLGGGGGGGYGKASKGSIGGWGGGKGSPYDGGDDGEMSAREQKMMGMMMGMAMMLKKDGGGGGAQDTMLKEVFGMMKGCKGGGGGKAKGGGKAGGTDKAAMMQQMLAMIG